MLRNFLRTCGEQINQFFSFFLSVCTYSENRIKSLFRIIFWQSDNATFSSKIQISTCFFGHPIGIQTLKTSFSPKLATFTNTLKIPTFSTLLNFQTPCYFNSTVCYFSSLITKNVTQKRLCLSSAFRNRERGEKNNQRAQITAELFLSSS